MFKKLLASVALLAIPGLSHATCDNTTCTALVYEIMVHKNFIYVRLDEPLSEFNKLTCNPLSDRYFILPDSTYHDSMFSAILAAQKANHRVLLYAGSGANGDCEISYVRSYAD